MAASLVAVIPLAIPTRVFAVVRGAPVTLFLIPGFFPRCRAASITPPRLYHRRHGGLHRQGGGDFEDRCYLAMGIAAVMSVPL